MPESLAHRKCSIKVSLTFSLDSFIYSSFSWHIMYFWVTPQIVKAEKNVDNLKFVFSNPLCFLSFPFICIFPTKYLLSLMLSNYLCPILYSPPEFTSLSKHRKMFFLFLSVSSQCVIPKQLHHEILKGDNVNTCNTCISMYSKASLEKNVPFTTQISPSHLLLSLGLWPLAATYSFISGYPSPLHPSNTHFQTCYHEFSLTIFLKRKIYSLKYYLNFSNMYLVFKLFLTLLHNNSLFPSFSRYSLLNAKTLIFYLQNLFTVFTVVEGHYFDS